MDKIIIKFKNDKYKVKINNKTSLHTSLMGAVSHYFGQIEDTIGIKASVRLLLGTSTGFLDVKLGADFANSEYSMAYLYYLVELLEQRKFKISSYDKKEVELVNAENCLLIEHDLFNKSFQIQKVEGGKRTEERNDRTIR